MSVQIEGWTFSEAHGRYLIADLVKLIDQAAWSRPAGLFATARQEAAAVQAALSAGAPLQACVESAWALLRQSRATLSTAGLLPRPMEGRVAGVFVSDGGVPKQPALFGEVGWSGLAGDRQKTQRHHGRPYQALCLWSAEAVEGLAAESHPIGPGFAGENLSIAGLDWSLVRPGVCLHLGAVRCAVLAYALPCSQNARWFHDGRIDRLHHQTEGGSSRVYAAVLQPGRLRVGDPAHLEPTQTSA